MRKYIIHKKKEGLDFLTIDRPEAYNALNRPLVDELEACIDRIAASETSRALLLLGGRHFAAGADIASMAEITSEEAANFAFSRTYEKLAALSIPTIAVIKGYALGGGLELALACDFRLAANTAKLGLPEVTLGIIPGAGGTQRLPRLIGCAAAKRLIFTGEIIEAEEALALGLVDALAEEDGLLEAAKRLAEKTRAVSKSAIAAAKRAIAEGEGIPLPAAIEKEALIWKDLFGTADQREGMRAFLEKRKPNYHTQNGTVDFTKS